MPKSDRKNDDNDQKGLRWMSAGIEFCGVISIFSYIGYRIDAAKGTGPAFLLTGFFVSFAGMMYLFYKDAK